MPAKGKKEEIALSQQELDLIKLQRSEMEAVEAFRQAYNKLVEESGFMWGVDPNSPLNNLQLGVMKVRK